MHIKLLWIANMGYSCSFNAVSELFIRSIKEYTNIELYLFCTGIGSKSIQLGELLKYVPMERIYTIESLQTPNRNMTDRDQIDYEIDYFHGVLKINHVLSQIDPNVIIHLNDAHLTAKMYDALLPVYKNRFIPYIPFDMDHLMKTAIPDSKFIMSTTKFAKKELERLECTSNIFTTYHIVSDFYPMDKLTAREKLNIPLDKFIIGSININHVRKKWDILLDAFSRFVRGKNDVLLLIKTHTLVPDKPAEYNSVPGDLYNLPEMFERYGIKNKVIVIQGSVEKERLNLIYNSLDLGLYTTSGEGWGMTPMETALCNVPSILPDNTTFGELFSNCGCLVETYNVPAIIGRSLNHNSFENSYICLFKVFQSWKTVKRSRYSINISASINTIVVSPYWQSDTNPINLPLTIVGHFRTFEEAVMKYKEIRNRTNIDRIQILINTQRDFLHNNMKQIIQFNKQFDAVEESELDANVKYSYQYTNGDRIEELAGDKFGSVKLPYINKVIAKLESFYKSKELRETVGKAMKKVVIDNCSPKVVINGLFEKIEKITASETL